MNQIIEEDLQYIYAKVDWELLRNKTILFTGATGMLLSYMVMSILVANKSPIKPNIKVIAFVRDKEKAEKKFCDFLPCDNFIIEQTDINKEIKLNTRIDYIVHGASPATSKDFASNPVGTILPNILGTYNLLELAKRNPVKGFLFISTDQIYGSIQGLKPIQETDIGLVDPLEIRSCYSESKRAAENLCVCYQHQYGIPIKITRVSHTFGPTLDILNDSRVYAGFIRNIVNNENIIMRSDGLDYLSFCYLCDAVVGFFIVLLYGNAGEAYNITNTNNRIQIYGLAQLLISMYPSKNLKHEIIKHNNANEFVTNKKINQATLDTTKIQGLGYKAEYDLKTAFKRTIDYFEQAKENTGG